MAFSLTSRVNANNGTSSSQTLTSASFTPTANSRLFVFAACERDGTATAQNWSVSNTGGLSFTLLDTSIIYSWSGNSDYSLNSVCWYADVGGSPTSMTVTVDPFDGGTETGFISLLGFDVTGYDSGTPFAQASVDDGASLGGGDSETDSIALGSAPTSGNLVVVLAGAGDDGNQAISTPTGFTALISQNNNYTHASAFYRTNTTTASVTISDFGQTVGNWGGVIFEMTLGGGGTPAVNKSETITVAESRALAVGTSQVTKSEAITVAEDRALLLRSLIAKSEAVGVAESLGVTVGTPSPSKSDAVGVAENVGVTIVTSDLTTNVNDAVGVAESRALSVGVNVSVSDAVGAAESVGVIIIGETLGIAITPDSVFVQGVRVR